MGKGNRDMANNYSLGDVENLLNGLERKSRKSHEVKVTAVRGGRDRATSLVSMSADEKRRYTEYARGIGLSLSAFFRTAANEYMRTHDDASA